MIYKDNYDLLMNSGLYDDLVGEGYLVRHMEVDNKEFTDDKVYKIIKPERIPFISYPYEWCFSQLKDAAITTIKIQKKALQYGMTLKDSSAYNIQFLKGKPILIDSLSFEKYIEGQPWVAYRQFCQHFLAPLALMSYTDIRLNQLLKVNIDGIPLDLSSKLLPIKSKLNLSIILNIYLHAKQQKEYSDKRNTKDHKLSKKALLAIIDNLLSSIKKLKWANNQTEWGDYYLNNNNYNDESFNCKKQLVNKYIDKTDSKTIWDVGANTGVFSRLASDKGINTVSFDIDPLAVEKNYLTTKEKNEINILPLVLDLTNPSSSIGWNNTERLSIKERDKADTILSLALIHHLAISNNLPFGMIASFFADLCDYLIIEFVPKEDSQVMKLLSTRVDIFDQYNQGSFECEFRKYFDILKQDKIIGSNRILYLMKKSLSTNFSLKS